MIFYYDNFCIGMDEADPWSPCPRATWLPDAETETGRDLRDLAERRGRTTWPRP